MISLLEGDKKLSIKKEFSVQDLFNDLYKSAQKETEDVEKSEQRDDISKRLQNTTDTSILIVDAQYCKDTGYRHPGQSDNDEQKQPSSPDYRSFLVNLMLPTERGAIRGDPTRTLARSPADKWLWYAFSFSETVYWCDRRLRRYSRH